MSDDQAATTSEPPTEPTPVATTSFIDDLRKDDLVRITALIIGIVLLFTMFVVATAASVKTVSLVTGRHDSHQMRERFHEFDGRGDRDGPGRSQRQRPQDSDPITPGIPDLPEMGGSQLPGLLGSLVTGLQHGDVVVAQPGQPATTMRVVKGAVTSIKGATITVKATDGYVSPFVVTATTQINGTTGTAGLAKVKTGSVVIALGTVKGTAVTADMIRAMS